LARKGAYLKVWSNYYIFLIIAAVFFALGLYSFFHQNTQTSHFFGISVKPTGETTLQTQALIDGQYKTVGAGFLVGKKINVSALVYLNDKQVYTNLRNMMQVANFVAVENSEAPQDANRDISGAIQEGDINKAFTNPGTVKMIKFYDDKQTIALEGDVVFTKEGVIEFGMPLKPILQGYNIEIQGIPIEPASAKFQIDLNRTVLLLTFVTIGVAFISLFFGLYKKA
jgi:hypothetical protein